MSEKLPVVSGAQIGRVLRRLGFVLHNQRGSHMKFVREIGFGKQIIVVPNHPTLRRGTLHGILKQVDLSIAELKKLL